MIRQDMAEQSRRRYNMSGQPRLHRTIKDSTRQNRIGQKDRAGYNAGCKREGQDETRYKTTKEKIRQDRIR